ncbi:hypothetical protein Emtol_0699 [Emticicia oligotrophica DSM 17448]|uniref:Uncharacterized protein n=1 Tax=Emticicia oligotrophica (strain DSM 17448 / CIP 109782 / MTCC 6937 / GPTSA100-15) TaxID=929562 RepID=A0ABN4AIK2_EMTOG|nr:hypothetical protein [Emticicia oligotrophica]AFK01852.1 hypothetical protein Emtol_0699 [Emticicia oligotrophica DSM 17448]
MTATWILGGIAIGVVALAIVSLVVMYLWNWLAPRVFKLPTIQFKHALGLLILSKILFGGFGGWHGGHHGFHHGMKTEQCKTWQINHDKKDLLIK